MAGYAFLGVKTQLRPDWEDQMGGPKVPSNWKDPAKIEAKKQEWRATAEEKSPEYPTARTVDTWVLLNKEKKEVAKGRGPKSLIDALVKHEKDITKILGLNARSVLKGASIDTMKEGGKAPTWLWYFAPLDNEHTRVFDPVDMLTSSFKEKINVDMVLRDFGFAPLSPDPEAHEAAIFACLLAEKLGLI